MKAKVVQILPGKLIAGFLVAVCVVLGAIGLILPIVPGLLFLAVAGLIGARHFPSMESRLRRSGAMSQHLDKADLIFGLTVWEKTKLSGLVFAKLVLDGIGLISASAMKSLGYARSNRYRRQ